MIDNDQSTIIEAPEVYKSIPTHSHTATPTTESRGNSHLNFDTFDGISPKYDWIVISHDRIFVMEDQPSFLILSDTHEPFGIRVL